ncbi:Uncharacterised protein [uncultured archaeon]|nr:Uncharacterised protein [uncultured archaeon]
MSSPYGIAVSAIGDVWTANYGGGTVTKLSRPGNSGVIVYNALYTGITGRTKTSTFQQNADWGTGTFTSKVIVIDSTATQATATQTYTVSSSPTTTVSTTSTSTTTIVGTSTTAESTTTIGSNSSTTTILNSSYTSSTTTIQSSGSGASSGGGGGGGGGGGTQRPIITRTADGYSVTDVSQLNTFSLMFGSQVDVTENYITPESASITINGTDYNYIPLYTPVRIGSNKTANRYVELTSVSYLPIRQTVSLSFFYNRTATPANATVTKTVITAPNATVSLNVSAYMPVQVEFTNAKATFSFTTSENETLPVGVSLSNVTRTALQAPANYSELVAVNISVNSNATGAVSTVIGYPCNIPAGAVAPFILKNDAWGRITPFSVNSTACEVAFTIPTDPVVALMQYLNYVNTTATTVTTVVSTLSTTTVQSTPTRGGGQAYATLVVATVAMAAILAAAAYVGLRKRKGEGKGEVPPVPPSSTAPPASPAPQSSQYRPTLPH